ncbi:hypothetical protein HHE02_09970 [Helicobacter heilmannii]|uniref:Uncharacterized protein n=2 Tax=Helicobacter TaxID=209 RepID=A0A0K2XB08_9HELI|nr:MULTISPECIES: hypothetical protein [Helicobacter]CRF46467.1 hypothetical protein HHE014_14780 [Helicobacter heilmannii]BEG58316.1 hypothetical protein NHP21005_20040 [Helicobacter sp. NHP21005]CCM11206.1 hypothetical protein BN341_2620 [Helicobacter heilmannii ASB1.4]CCM73325.1 hypothetical protein BN341_2660 [Helicobacter heilmannii ASB1.4]CRF41473.1 hypothetical protein HAL011_12710 [Helicobacter ailurogastricus]
MKLGNPLSVIYKKHKTGVKGELIPKEWYGYGYKHIYMNPKYKHHAAQKPVEILEHCLAIVPSGAWC